MFCGRSTCFLGDRIRASFDTVDAIPWDLGMLLTSFGRSMKSINHQQLLRVREVIRRSSTLHEIARRLIAASEFSNRLPMSYAAYAASQADNSLDFVFVSAEHTYDNSRDLLHARLPKIRIGGVLAGHDYPEVVRALHEVLGMENMQEVGACFYYTRRSHV